MVCGHRWLWPSWSLFAAITVCGRQCRTPVLLTVCKIYSCIEVENHKFHTKLSILPTAFWLRTPADQPIDWSVISLTGNGNKRTSMKAGRAHCTDLYEVETDILVERVESKFRQPMIAPCSMHQQQLVQEPKLSANNGNRTNNQNVNCLYQDCDINMLTRNTLDCDQYNYSPCIVMSPLRRHIFVCFMAKSAFWRGFSALAPYTGVGPI